MCNGRRVNVSSIVVFGLRVVGEMYVGRKKVPARTAVGELRLALRAL